MRETAIESGDDFVRQTFNILHGSAFYKGEFFDIKFFLIANGIFIKLLNGKVNEGYFFFTHITKFNESLINFLNFMMHFGHKLLRLFITKYFVNSLFWQIKQFLFIISLFLYKLTKLLEFMKLFNQIGSFYFLKKKKLKCNYIIICL